jgi:hypothetical protein
MMIELTPIGCVVSVRDDTRDDFWGEVEARIELSPDFTPEALAGIEEFSHVEVIFFFDRVPQERIERGAAKTGRIDWASQLPGWLPGKSALSLCAVWMLFTARRSLISNPS